MEDNNSDSQNIKLTKEVHPSNFLDTELIRENVSTLAQVLNKPHKFPVQWSSKIPIRYNCNVVSGELDRAKWIAFSFDKEIWRIEKHVEMLVFHHFFLLKLSIVLKKKQKKLLYLNGCLKKEKHLLQDFPYSSANKKFSKLFVYKVEYYILTVKLN